MTRWGPTKLSPGGGLAFIGSAVVREEELPELLRTMVELSADWLRAHPGAPRVIDVARYEREPEGENDWLALPVTLDLYDAEYAAAVGHRPYRDCEDVTIGDVAEELMAGNRQARGLVVKSGLGPHMRHIVTSVHPGEIRDMSKILFLKYQGT